MLLAQPLLSQSVAMNVSIYQAAAALNANARWQESIASNMASSSVPGFKKQNLSFATIQAGLNPAQAAAMPTLTTATNFQQGELKFTGSATDLAIEGQGFFEVQLPNGDHALTRDGAFHLNAQGQLVTAQGCTVVSPSGPIQIDRNNPAQLSISATGQVSQGADIKGQIKLTNVDKPQLLQSIGNGSFLARDPKLKTTDATDARLHQGYLENSNTAPVVEMAQLINAMRQFEANQKVVQNQDDRMNRAITELGNPS